MTKFSFADRYAESGLAPTGQVIAARQAPAERILGEISNNQIIDLVGVYYSSPSLDLIWFRDKFAEEDASFSLINNERETRVLAASMLGSLIADGSVRAILAIVAGYVAGHRTPAQAEWLIRDANDALGRLSVANRKIAAVETKVVPTIATKLGDEIAALPANDWPGLLAVLAKMRSESQSSAKLTSGQATTALTALNHQIRLLREESQMLWWLTGGHSRTLERSFSAFEPSQAVIVGAVDLGDLTTVTTLGPVAVPAMLERVIAMAKRSKGASARNLASAVDGLPREDLERLNIFPQKIPARLAPITAAVSLATSIGVGAWHPKFQEITGLEASMVLEPIDLACQLYREHTLGQLL